MSTQQVVGVSMADAAKEIGVHYDTIRSYVADKMILDRDFVRRGRGKTAKILITDQGMRKLRTDYPTAIAAGAVQAS